MDVFTKRRNKKERKFDEKLAEDRLISHGFRKLKNGTYMINNGLVYQTFQEAIWEEANCLLPENPLLVFQVAERLEKEYLIPAHKNKTIYKVISMSFPCDEIVEYEHMLYLLSLIFHQNKWRYKVKVGSKKHYINFEISRKTKKANGVYQNKQR